MIIQFHSPGVTFFEDDQSYFEKRISTLMKFLGNRAGDQDTVKVDIHLEKDKHKAGERFYAKAHMSAPNGGSFHADTNAENIKALADKLKDLLKVQVRRFKDKRK